MIAGHFQNDGCPFYSKPFFKIIQNQVQINSSRVPPMRCLGGGERGGGGGGGEEQL